MDPEQAALAAELLGADRLVPIHYDGYSLSGIYEPAETRSSASRTRVGASSP
jgi:L-ascorbate metabolism protein UlaG (beta-lactamase superfamily)